MKHLKWYMQWSLGLGLKCMTVLFACTDIAFAKAVAAPAKASPNESCFGRFGVTSVIIGTRGGSSVSLCIPVTIVHAQSK